MDNVQDMNMDMGVQGPAPTEDFEMGFISPLYIESALLMLLFIAGLLANVPVLILYFRSKHIRSITDKFLLNLLLADIASVILLFPVILSSFVQTSSSSLDIDADNLVSVSSSSQFLHGTNTQQHDLPLNMTPMTFGAGGEDDLGHEIEYEYWKWNCALSNGILAGLATASVLAALEIAMERYLAVVKPLHYHKLLTTPSIFVTSIIGGAISLATAIIASIEPSFSFFPHCHQQLQVQRQAHLRQRHGGGGGILMDSENRPESRPFLNLSGESNSNDRSSPNLTSGDLIWSLYSLASVTFLFVIPVIFMLYIYSKIWMEARRQRIKLANQYKPYFLPVPSDHIVSKESDGKKEKHGTFLPIIIKFRLMSRLRATRLDRAGRVAVIALVVTILCWSPYYFFKTSRAIQTLLTMYGYESQSISSPSSTSWYRTALPLIFAALHPILSPLFYAYRYKRLRTEIFKWISSLCVPTDPSNNGANNRWDGRKGDRGGGGYTNSGIHTNTNSISGGGGGTPCIRQVIITQNHPPPQPPGPVVVASVLTRPQLLQPTTPPPCVVVVDSSGDKGVRENQVHLVLDEDCDDFSIPNEKVSRDLSSSNMDEDDRSYSFHTPTSNICINIFSSEDEHDEGQGVGGALDSDNDHSDKDEGSRGRDSSNAISSNSFVGGIVRVERSVGNFFNYLNVWVNSYSRRWLQHRESVTSTSSFITLLSSKYHNKSQTVASV